MIHTVAVASITSATAPRSRTGGRLRSRSGKYAKRLPARADASNSSFTLADSYHATMAVPRLIQARTVKADDCDRFKRLSTADHSPKVTTTSPPSHAALSKVLHPAVLNCGCSKKITTEAARQNRENQRIAPGTRRGSSMAP